MSRSKLLLDLQSIDSTCDAAAAKRKRIALAMRGNKAEREATTTLATKEEDLANAESALRKIQDERTTLKAKLEADTKVLYDNRRKSAREVNNLQLEVASFQRRLETLDDTALEAMEAKDIAQTARDQANEVLAAAKSLQARQRTALKAEDKRLETALGTLDGQRQNLRAAIDVADLGRYDKLRAAKGGVAVAKLESQSCSACGRQITSDEQVHFRSGQPDIHVCRGCGRIIHT